jgi:hypothetical protein
MPSELPVDVRADQPVRCALPSWWATPAWWSGRYEGLEVRVTRCGSDRRAHEMRTGRIAAIQRDLLGGGDAAVLVRLDDGACCYAAEIETED